MLRILSALLLFSFTCSAQCDASLWDHVYNRSRLNVRNGCVTATGTVEDLFYANDGDIHIMIRLDTAFNWMLNDGNMDDQRGCLVVEPVCATTPIYSSALEACSGFTNTVYTPNIGEHVAVTGPYVTDNSHGWNEIHPVSSIRITTETSGVFDSSSVRAPSLTVYPNPTYKDINFLLSAKPASTVYITVLNAVGQLAGQYQMLETVKLTLTTKFWPAGTYYYHLEQGGKEQQAGSFIVK